MNREDITVYFIWMQLAFGIANDKINRIFRVFGYDARAVYQADRGYLAELMEMSDAQKRRMAQASLQQAYAIIDRCRQLAVPCHILTPDSEQYPDRLRHIYSPPLVLYSTQPLDKLDRQLIITMVGTRESSKYGEWCAKRISFDLAKMGVVIASGLAGGIDACCHSGALNAGGLTIAVLGNGLNVDYPRQNEDLQRLIERNGIVITEYPPDSKPEAWHFPIRNRILSGISLGVVMVEAPLKSGARITVDYAQEQGKDVFVVTGSIQSSAGQSAIKLLREGAIAIAGAADVIEEYRFRLAHTVAVGDLAVKTLSLSDFDREKVNELIHSEAHIDKKKSEPKPKKTEPKQISRPEPEDVRSFEAVELPVIEEKELPTLNDNQQRVYNCLSELPIYISDISKKTELNIPQSLLAVTELEIMGLIKTHAGGRFSL